MDCCFLIHSLNMWLLLFQVCADQGLRNGGLRKPLFWHWLRRLRQTQNRQMLNPTKTRCNDIRLAMPRDRTNIASSQHGAISCDQNAKSIRRNIFVIRAGFKVHTPSVNSDLVTWISLSNDTTGEQPEWDCAQCGQKT